MFECDMCLSGWYMCCFKSSLTCVLESDWYCLLCVWGGEVVSVVL